MGKSRSHKEVVTTYSDWMIEAAAFVYHIDVQMYHCNDYTWRLVLIIMNATELAIRYLPPTRSKCGLVELISQDFKARECLGGSASDFLAPQRKSSCNK